MILNIILFLTKMSFLCENVDALVFLSIVIVYICKGLQTGYFYFLNIFVMLCGLWDLCPNQGLKQAPWQ